MGDIMTDIVVDSLLAEIVPLPATERVRAALLERKELGIERYGVPLSFSMTHVGAKDLEEEILDGIVYARHIGRLDICRKLIHIFNDI
jgi:hypothetical protein